MKDGLVQLGSNRTEAIRQAKALEQKLYSEVGDPYKIALRSLTIALVSLAVYATVVMLIFEFYQTRPLWVMFGVTLASAIAVFVLSRRTERWQHLMGGFVAAATFLGILVGLHIFYSFLIYYLHYNSLRVETNVAASQPAALFADVGMVQFTSDTRLDVGRSLGYRAAYLAETLCVAPVVDSMMSPTDGVSFFAVGAGCCEWRSSFDCDDAGQADAGYGLLALDASALVSPFMRWAVEDPLLADDFENAVKMSRAAFGTTLADKVRFLRWTKDPQALRDAYSSRAWSEFRTSLLVLFFVTLLAAVCAITAVQKAPLQRRSAAATPLAPAL